MPPPAAPAPKTEVKATHPAWLLGLAAGLTGGPFGSGAAFVGWAGRVWSVATDGARMILAPADYRTPIDVGASSAVGRAMAALSTADKRDGLPVELCISSETLYRWGQGTIGSTVPVPAALQGPMGDVIVDRRLFVGLLDGLTAEHGDTWRVKVRAPGLGVTLAGPDGRAAVVAPMSGVPLNGHDACLTDEGVTHRAKVVTPVATVPAAPLAAIPTPAPTVIRPVAKASRMPDTTPPNDAAEVVAEDKRAEVCPCSLCKGRPMALPSARNQRAGSLGENRKAA